MTLYELTEDGLFGIDTTTFREAQVHERYDLQRVLRENIDVISEGTLVIAEEFSEWEDSGRRIDLLGVDPDGTLVVVELKRSQHGGFMDLQAIRYAAMVSAMTLDRAIGVFRGYLERNDRQDADAKEILLEHLEESDDTAFGDRVRIVLASMDFGKELTTAVMWLNQQGLDIRCVRLAPYTIDKRVLLDVQQVLPLPEAEDYIVRLKEKAIKERHAQRDRAAWKGYWFVNVGMASPDIPETHGRHWNNCKRLGYLAAGGGQKYWGALKKLSPGDPVFAYVKKGVGYVGFGIVTHEASPVHQLRLDDGLSLNDHLAGQHTANNRPDNEERWEWAVRVDWKSTVPLREGKQFKGAFANQNVVCKLRDETTLAFLLKEFSVEHRGDREVGCAEDDSK